eukprot:3863920-Rhodomonas_salina.1
MLPCPALPCPAWFPDSSAPDPSMTAESRPCSSSSAGDEQRARGDLRHGALVLLRYHHRGLDQNRSQGARPRSQAPPISCRLRAHLTLARAAPQDEWDAAEHPAWLQPLQWSLAGVVPLAFLLGLSLTALMQYRVGRSLKRLRGDFEHPPDGASSDDVRTPLIECCARP